MSQLKAAFVQAGYQDAEDWPSAALRVVVEKAMISNASDSDAAQRAIFDACCPRNSLARALFAPWQREATSAVIAEVRRLLKASQQSESLNTRQRSILEVVRLDEERAAAAASIARQRMMEEQGRAAQQRQQQLNEWLGTHGASEMIDGSPWWEVSPARLYQHARKTTHRSKFWNLVLERVPSHDDQRPISYYLKPGDVNPLWNEAWGNDTHD